MIEDKKSFGRILLPYRPTTTSSVSDDLGRKVLQTSMVKMVELLLNMDVKELISAAIMTASIKPRRPVPSKEALTKGTRQLFLGKKHLLGLFDRTCGHQFDDDLGISVVCATLSRTADLLADFRHHTPNLI
jgi:hypothetical protein